MQFINFPPGKIGTKVQENRPCKTVNGKCSECGRTAVLHSTGECSWCTPKPALLAENAEEAQAHVAAGRSWPALKASKVFDSERLSTSPLFERRLF